MECQETRKPRVIDRYIKKKRSGLIRYSEERERKNEQRKKRTFVS